MPASDNPYKSLRATIPDIPLNTSDTYDGTPNLYPFRICVGADWEMCLGPYLPERTRGRPWGRLRVRIRSIEKTWSWKFYPAAQNLTNRMLFRNTQIFKTISLLWKHCHLIHLSSIFSTIQRNNQQSARNTSYILQLYCALVRDLT